MMGSVLPPLLVSPKTEWTEIICAYQIAAQRIRRIRCVTSIKYVMWRKLLKGKEKERKKKKKRTEENKKGGRTKGG